MKALLAIKIRRWFLLALICLFPTAKLYASTDIKIIHAGYLLAVPGEDIRERSSIIIENGLIKEIKAGFIQADEVSNTRTSNISIIDLSDQYVLPGLIDMHSHLSLSTSPNYYEDMVLMPEAKATMNAVVNAHKTLAAGFTTVRNTGADSIAVIALRDAIDRGEHFGPRILAAGYHISPTGGAEDLHGFKESIMDHYRPNGVCNGVDDCRRVVRLQVKLGADFIKVNVNGLMSSFTETGIKPQFTDQELRAIIETAHNLGRPVAAHAHSPAGINAALRAGADTIEHGTFPDKESFKLYQKTKAYWVPTMTGRKAFAEMTNIFNRELRDGTLAMRKDVKAMLDSYRKETLGDAFHEGINIAFGTDAGSFPHGENASEFDHMVDAGMSPEGSIVAATVNAAKALGLSDQVGSIEADKHADIIAVKVNPLDNISILKNIGFVMRSGKVVKNNYVH